MTTDWMKQNDAYPPEWCIYFTGIGSEKCEAGVDYKSVRDDSGPGMYRWPCILKNDQTEGKCKTTCTKLVKPTQEQIERYETKSREHIEQFMKELNSDICPHCHKPIKEYHKVGRCVYAHPCGHRLYQGQLPKDKPGRRIGKPSPYEDA